jgi:hypothetical protein
MEDRQALDFIFFRLPFPSQEKKEASEVRLDLKKSKL